MVKNIDLENNSAFVNPELCFTMNINLQCCSVLRHQVCITGHWQKKVLFTYKESKSSTKHTECSIGFAEREKSAADGTHKHANVADPERGHTTYVRQRPGDQSAKYIYSA